MNERNEKKMVKDNEIKNFYGYKSSITNSTTKGRPTN
jgi:hypothetical protein